VAGGQVGDICPSHTQPGPSQHFGDPATFQRSASQFFQLGLCLASLKGCSESNKKCKKIP